MNDKYTRKKGKQANNETKATKIANQPTNLTHDPHPQPRDLTSETTHRYRPQLIRGRLMILMCSTKGSFLWPRTNRKFTQRAHFVHVN